MSNILAQPIPSTLKYTLIQTLNGFILLFLTSQVTIPLQPVPITLQTVGVILIGLTFARREAITAVLSYIFLGAAGLPVFSGFSGGFHKISGPTSGYLLGFVVAVTAMTTIRQIYKKENITFMILNASLGTSIIYIFGISWLTYLIGFAQAIKFGLLPFIVPGIIKILITSISIRYIKFGKIYK